MSSNVLIRWRGVLVFVLVVVGGFLLVGSENGSKKVIVHDKKYLTASEAGFSSEALYSCVLKTLGSDRTSATDEELANITEVVCPGQNITSATGIEKLTGLRYLNLYNNKLSSIDLSKNTNLVMLNLTFNSISSIDLSKNTNLQQLYMNGNKLTSIDLSKNSLLIDLDLYNNKISSINVSNLSNLKFLLLSLNKLSSIDLSNNAKLEHVYLSGNQLSSLKFSSSANNLTRLDLNANKLSSIDLSGMPNLDYLIVSDNNLSSLDISKNVNLEYLYGSANKISGINVSNNTKLIDLDLYNNALSSIDLSKNVNLQYLNVSVNGLKTLNLKGLTKLSKLYASSNNLSSLSLDSQSNLSELNVVFNNFDNITLSDKSKITYLAIEDEWLDSIDLSAYANLKYLSINSYMTIPVFGTATTVLDVVKNIPSKVTLNKYDVYSGTNNIDALVTNTCSYDVKYTMSGSTTTEQTTSINTCGNNKYSSSDIKGNSGDVVRLQIFSNDLSASGISNLSLTYNGYYNVKFITLTSDKYIIDDDANSIDVSGDSDSDIIKNLNVPSGVNLSISNNKLIVKYGNSILKEYSLKRITNPKTGSVYILVVMGLLILSVSIFLVINRKRVKNTSI